MAFDRTATENEARRRMVAASAVSAILHLIVLWPRFPDLPEPAAPQPPVLRARLRQPTTDAQPLLAPRPAAAVPPAPTLAPTLAKVRQRPAAAVTTQAQESSPAPAPVVSAPSSPSSIAPREPSAAAASSSPAASAASAAPPAVDAGSFAEGLRVYRIALATQARRFKRYPAQAQAAGWGGTVEVRLDLPAGAVMPALSLARSSGHEALDRAALAMVDAGIARVRPSELLRERGFTLLLPVLFELDE